MPNIEIHGFGSWETGMVSNKERARFIRDVIIRDVPELAKDVVLDVYPDECRDLEGRLQPFLRICSSDPTHFELLVTALSPLKMDMELVLLPGFYPAQK